MTAVCWHRFENITWKNEIVEVTHIVRTTCPWRRIRGYTSGLDHLWVKYVSDVPQFPSFLRVLMQPFRELNFKIALSRTSFFLSLRYCRLLLLLTLFLRAPVSGGCILPWCPVQCVLHFWTNKLIDWLTFNPECTSVDWRPASAKTRWRRGA